MIRNFFNLNRRVCDWIERHLPNEFKKSLLVEHTNSVLDLINRKSDLQRVLDVGGGNKTPFAKQIPIDAETEILGLDISERELRANQEILCKIVGDASLGIPLATGSIDLIVTRSVIEHLQDTEKFITECGRVLATSGACVHLFPNRNSPFAWINSVLPDTISAHIVHYIYPEWRQACGFPAFYAQCTYNEIANMMRNSGIEIEVSHIRYYQSIYFKFFVPFYLVSLIYDLGLWTLGLRRLCAQVLVVGRKVTLPPDCPRS